MMQTIFKKVKALIQIDAKNKKNHAFKSRGTFHCDGFGVEARKKHYNSA